jgi:ABC-type oligopeptide transport system substrate-binding subunit
MKGPLLLVLAVLFLLAGCQGAYTSRSNENYYPAIGDVPPSFYNDNPSLRDWYTFPYWAPDVGP